MREISFVAETTRWRSEESEMKLRFFVLLSSRLSRLQRGKSEERKAPFVIFFPQLAVDKSDVMGNWIQLFGVVCFCWDLRLESDKLAFGWDLKIREDAAVVWVEETEDVWLDGMFEGLFSVEVRNLFSPQWVMKGHPRSSRLLKPFESKDKNFHPLSPSCTSSHASSRFK
jgi:hypothetical protein